jgi:hypothetical protein
MAGVIPATGTAIKMGSVYNAYYVSGATVAPAAGTAVTLNATLGSKISIAAGTITKLSANFGGRATPYTYIPL